MTEQNKCLSDDIGERERALLTAALKAHPAYRLANRDPDLLQSDDLRPVRLQLELLKPERAIAANHIVSTIVVFGSARILPPDAAVEQLAALEARHEKGQSDPELRAALLAARKRVEYSRYYEEARRFARLMSQVFQRVIDDAAERSARP